MRGIREALPGSAVHNLAVTPNVHSTSTSMSRRTMLLKVSSAPRRGPYGRIAPCASTLPTSKHTAERRIKQMVTIEGLLAN